MTLAEYIRELQALPVEWMDLPAMFPIYCDDVSPEPVIPRMGTFPSDPPRRVVYL